MWVRCLTLTRTVGDGGITINAGYYAAVSNGSIISSVEHPHLAMWATNIPSAPRTQESSSVIVGDKKKASHIAKPFLLFDRFDAVAAEVGFVY